ncbi:hypothetical protein SAMN05443550_101559 [Pedobacter hartonius]|uniref:Uncharacterized protein n=1 Tax=Pedobacter hartonius TaxID=425514 RepID=A0A1H3XAT0_9SPHI|nr:hypothetical protein SAMN05443550_101559 [Pedobacter hartonius]
MYLFRRASAGEDRDYGFLIYISLVFILICHTLLEFFCNI